MLSFNLYYFFNWFSKYNYVLYNNTIQVSNYHQRQPLHSIHSISGKIFLYIYAGTDLTFLLRRPPVIFKSRGPTRKISIDYMMTQFNIRYPL